LVSGIKSKQVDSVHDTTNCLCDTLGKFEAAVAIQPWKAGKKKGVEKRKTLTRKTARKRTLVKKHAAKEDSGEENGQEAD
jgi:hypothetical protein